MRGSAYSLKAAEELHDDGYQPRRPKDTEASSIRSGSERVVIIDDASESSGFNRIQDDQSQASRSSRFFKGGGRSIFRRGAGKSTQGSIRGSIRASERSVSRKSRQIKQSDGPGSRH